MKSEIVSNNQQDGDFRLGRAVAIIAILMGGRWIYAHVISPDVPYDLMEELIRNIAIGFAVEIIPYLWKRRERG